MAEIAWVIAGALVGGLVNGLTGFGMAMSAMVFWLQAMPPGRAATLAALTAVVAHLQTVSVIYRVIDVSRVWPFIVGGLIGIPLGTWLLVRIDVVTFKLAIGALIVAYCAVMLSGRFRLDFAGGGGLADGAVGLGGGVLGGLSALSGALPAIWAGIRGWGRDERRAVFQPFNMAILSVTVVVHAFSGLFTAELFRAIVFAIPAAIVGALIGKRVYRRLGDWHFDRLVLAILLAAGLALIASNWAGVR